MTFFNFLLETTSGSGIIPLLGIVLLFVVMYFFMIRPQKKQERRDAEMRDALAVGDEVTTIGGVTGTVVDVKENKFVLETGADRVRIEFAKFALSENHTAAARAVAESKKAKEQAAKAKAAKKSEK